MEYNIIYYYYSNSQIYYIRDDDDTNELKTICYRELNKPKINFMLLECLKTTTTPTMT